MSTTVLETCRGVY